MNVSQFSIIINNIWNQLNLRNFSNDSELKFDLCQSKDSVLNDNQVFIEIESSTDALDILKHFNIAWDLKSSDINQIIKEKGLITSKGICLILEIQ